MKTTTQNGRQYRFLAVVYSRYKTGACVRLIPNRSCVEKPPTVDIERPKTAVIYIRVASAPQNHSESSDSATNRQVGVCTSAAEARGLQITDTFSDVGASGNATRRIGFYNLIQHPKTSPTDYVIVADHTRLGRGHSTFQVLMTEIEGTGAQLLVANEVDAPKVADLYDEYIAKRKETDHAANPLHRAPTRHSAT